MKLSGKILSTLVAGLLLIVPAFAQSGDGIVSGKVIGRDGMPAPAGIVIYVDRMNSQNALQKVVAQRFEVKTGKNGSYSQNGLPPGAYVVTLVENGRPLMVKGDAVGDTILIASGREGIANFDMTKAPAAAAAGPAPGAPPPSAADLAKDREEMEKAAKNKGTRDKAFAAGTAAYKAGVAWENGKPETPVKTETRGNATTPNATVSDCPDAKACFEEAATQFQIVVVADPKQDVAFANLGNAFNKLKKYDEAAAAYQKAIQLKPMEAAYFNNLGLSLGAQKKLDEAKAAFETAATLDPVKGGDYLFNQGAMYNNNNDYPKAIEAFKKTLEKDPNNKAAMLQIAISYMGTESTWPQAVPILEKFLTLKPTASDAAMANAFLDAIKTSAPTEYKSEKAIAEEKAKAAKQPKTATPKTK